MIHIPIHDDIANWVYGLLLFNLTMIRCDAMKPHPTLPAGNSLSTKIDRFAGREEFSRG